MSQNIQTSFYIFEFIFNFLQSTLAERKRNIYIFPMVGFVGLILLEIKKKKQSKKHKEGRTSCKDRNDEEV